MGLPQGPPAAGAPHGPLSQPLLSPSLCLCGHGNLAGCLALPDPAPSLERLPPPMELSWSLWPGSLLPSSLLGPAGEVRAFPRWLQGFHPSGLFLPSEVVSRFQPLACLFLFPCTASCALGLCQLILVFLTCFPSLCLPSLARSQYFTYGPFICGWGWLRGWPSGHVGPFLSLEVGPCSRGAHL